MLECCGSHHATAFCPNCGKDLSAHDPILGLLRHVRSVHGRLVKKIERGDRSKHLLRDHDKWERWLTELEALLAGRTAMPPRDWKTAAGQNAANFIRELERLVIAAETARKELESEVFSDE